MHDFTVWVSYGKWRKNWDIRYCLLHLIHLSSTRLRRCGRILSGICEPYCLITPDLTMHYCPILILIDYTSCSEYFNRLCPGIPYKMFVVVNTVVSMALANKGLSSILTFSIPMLMLLYPLTIVIILLVFLHKLFGGSRIVYFCTMMATLAVGLLDAYKAAFGFSEEVAADINGALPLYNVGLGWLLPATVSFVLGCILNAALKKKA